MNTRIFLVFLLPLMASAQRPAPASTVDKAAMNTAVDPCTDFYQYACGNWNASHPLPADRARYGRFNELQDHNERISLDILQGAMAKANRTGLEQKIGDFYASCMDTATIDKKGLDPLKPELDRIAAMKDMPASRPKWHNLQRIGVRRVVRLRRAARPQGFQPHHRRPAAPAACLCPTAITISRPTRNPSKSASITCST